MAKIHTLNIKNFRGIQDFEQVFGITDFICLIGRGDSGKTTILNAISMVLSPSWNLSFYDTDFYNCEIDKNIEIEATLYDLPNSFLRENKYGLYIRGIDKDSHKISDEVGNNQISALTIKLIVDRELEPQWYIINGREQDPIEIKASDRAILNAFLISDYVDRHFSWSKGNPLYSLLKLEDTADNVKSNFIADAMREAKIKVDGGDFSHLQGVINKVETSTRTLGVPVQKITTSIDFKDFTSNESKIYLHEENIPFKQRGKGSKRLISTAIQLELVKKGGILLIDEVEQGLEPDRTKHLVRTLKKNNTGQIFITTHSSNILVELQVKDIFRVEKNRKSLYEFSKEVGLQGTVRSNPEAFFANKVLVCEGATEVGLVRGINNYRVDNDKENVSVLGVHYADGGGSTQIERAKAFINLGYNVCLFCDSDVETINTQKNNLESLGINIIDCDNNFCTEHQIFNDLPWESIIEILDNIRDIDEQSINDSIKSKYQKFGNLPIDWKEKGEQIENLRWAIGESAKKNSWFKRIDYGEYLGYVCTNSLDKIQGTTLEKQFTQLSKWIDDEL